MDTQLHEKKTLPKIKLSLLSVNFLKQKDSKILLTYIEKLYQVAELNSNECQKINFLLKNNQNELDKLNSDNKLLKKELQKANEVNKKIKASQSADFNGQEFLIVKKELLSLKKGRESQNIKHKIYIAKFKNKVRRLFQNYANQSVDQVKKLKQIQHSSKEIQRLITVAQQNNNKLSKDNYDITQENKKLDKANKDNKQSLYQLNKEFLLSKKIHSDFLSKQQDLKEKAMSALKALESEIEKLKIEIEKNKKIICKKNDYITKIQTPLKENKKELFKLNTENAELNMQAKIQAKNQNNLIIKLRQHQDDQEKLEQQRLALQQLNQNISLSLNQCRQQIQQMKNVKENESFITPSHIKSLGVDRKKPISKILSKLYSGYNK
ncbi:MAG: hypothetical protein HAW60_04330 [Bdellovibrionales bacterium]|nr:hypothetical protein [Bdellovibrionales bacterium]